MKLSKYNKIVLFAILGACVANVAAAEVTFDFRFSGFMSRPQSTTYEKGLEVFDDIKGEIWQVNGSYKVKFTSRKTDVLKGVDPPSYPMPSETVLLTLDQSKEEESAYRYDRSRWKEADVEFALAPVNMWNFAKSLPEDTPFIHQRVEKPGIVMGSSITVEKMGSRFFAAECKPDGYTLYGAKAFPRFSVMAYEKISLEDLHLVFEILRYGGLDAREKSELLEKVLGRRYTLILFEQIEEESEMDAGAE